MSCFIVSVSHAQIKSTIANIAGGLSAALTSTVNRVSFWGIDDGHSWLKDFPMIGRANYPLIFDRKYKAKLPLFIAIQTALK